MDILIKCSVWYVQDVLVGGIIHIVHNNLMNIIILWVWYYVWWISVICVCIVTSMIFVNISWGWSSWLWRGFNTVEVVFCAAVHFSVQYVVFHPMAFWSYYQLTHPIYIPMYSSYNTYHCLWYRMVSYCIPYIFLSMLSDYTPYIYTHVQFI